mmetsp:Transcript_9629/g.22441  ORF Transcript_9629/g.22441 Transcript_9629/m.22441 type:complete len:329 (+) Transcript_9629:2911-3897(+)
MEAGAQLGHGFGPRRALPGQGVVGQDELHQLVELDIGGHAAHAVPDVEAVAGGGACEVDVDLAGQQLGVGRVDRAGQAVELHHLLQRRQQREADRVEQDDGAVLHQPDAVAGGDGRDQRQAQATLGREGQVDPLGRNAERLGHGVEGLGVEVFLAGQQLVQQPGAPRDFGLGQRAVAVGVLGQGLVWRDQHAQALGLGRPRVDQVVAQAPQRVEGLVEQDDVVAQLGFTEAGRGGISHEAIQPGPAFAQLFFQSGLQSEARIVFQTGDKSLCQADAPAQRRPAACCAGASARGDGRVRIGMNPLRRGGWRWSPGAIARPGQPRAPHSR